MNNIGMPGDIFPIEPNLNHQFSKMIGTNSNGSVKRNRISIYNYIAQNNREEAIAYLRKRGIVVPSPQSTELIAKGLHYVMKHGNENDSKALLQIHPDYDLFKDEFDSTDGVKGFNPNPAITTENTLVNDKLKSEQSSQQQVNNNSIISKETAHILIGVGITATAIFTVGYLVKNFKSN